MRRGVRAREVIATATVVCMCALCSGGDAWAHVFDLLGCTSKGAAVGPAMVAMDGDAASLYYNPAALAEVNDVLISLSYLYADQALSIDGKDTDVDSQSGLVIGVVVPARSRRVKGSGGALFFIPDKRLARYLLMPKDRPRFVLYSNDAQRMVALFPVAVELAPWLAVGAGVSLLVDMTGEQRIYVSEQWRNIPSVGSHSEDFRPTFAPYGGLLFKYKDRMRVGLCYAEKSEFNVRITPVVMLPDMYVYETMPVPLIRQTRIDAIGEQASHFSPGQLTVGAALRLWPTFKIAGSLSWVRWSQYKEYTPRVQLKLTGPPGNLADWVTIIEFPIPPPEFRDILVPTFGLEYRALSSRHVDLDVRCGYAYRPTPVRAQTGVTNFVDSDEHVPSWGVGVTIKDVFRVVTKPVSLDAHAQYHILTRRKTVKANPADPFGDYEAKGRILNVGATITVRF